MKKWLAVLLMLCILSTVAFAETQEKTYGIDYLGYCFFGMSKDEIKEYEYNYDGNISARIMSDRTAVVYDYFEIEGSDIIGETLFIYLDEAGNAVSGSLLDLWKSDGSVEETIEMDYSEVSAWLRIRFGDPQYSKEAGTAAPTDRESLYTEDGFFDVEMQGVPATREVMLDDYEEWVLPMSDGTWMLVYHGKGIAVTMDKETGELLNVRDFNSVSFYPYIPE